jgi:hypothetical protein
LPESHPGVAQKATTGTRTRRTTTENNPVAAKKATATTHAQKGTTSEEVPMTTTNPTAAELSRLALAEAKTTHAEALALRGDRETAAEELRAFLASGQATPADLDAYVPQYRTTLDAVEVAALLAQGCEGNVKRADRALINDDTAVADLIRDVLNDDIYRGQVPIKVVTVPGDVVKPTGENDPVFYIVQKRASANDAGILSATLMLHYFRPPLYAAFDGDKLDEACRERNYVVNVGMWASNDDGNYVEDVAEVKVKRAFPTVPTLSREAGETEIVLYANAVRNALRNAMTYYGQRAEVHLSGEPVEGRANATMVSHRIVSHKKARDGNSRLTIETVHAVRPDAMLVGQPIAEMMREAIRKQLGTMADNVGRVVSIDHLDVKTPDVPKSRYADPEPFTVTAHFGIMYRIG